MKKYEEILSGRNYAFSATLSEIAMKTEKRLNAVQRQSTQDLINFVQTPVAKGGKMRVKTGFLRASGQVSLNGMPTGPVRGDKDKKYDSGNSPITGIAEIAKAQLGTTIFFGWTANYAIYREAYDGFLFAGIQQWQSIVDNVVNRLEKVLKNG